MNNNLHSPLQQPSNVDLKKAKNTYSAIGFAICGIIVAVFLIFVILKPFQNANSPFLQSSTGKWIIEFLPIYGIAVPIGILMMSHTPTYTPKKRDFTAKAFLAFICVTFFVTSVGNIIGNTLSLYLSNGTAENAVATLSYDTNPLKIVVMVILAPIIEEYIFRKQILDRTVVYGEKTAIIFSGLIFGLYHMNLFQFFYAFFAGMVLSYMYVKSGKLRYPILLHMVINFFGSVIAPFVVSLIDKDLVLKLESLDPEFHQEEITQIFNQLMPGLTALLIYCIVFYGLSIAGLVIFVKKRRQIRWEITEQQLPEESIASTVYMNIGVILLVTLTASLTLVSVFN